MNETIMSRPSTLVSSSTKFITNTTTALESSLNQSLNYCQDLIKQCDDLIFESEETKKKLVTQKEQCESKLCRSSEELMKTIEIKNNMLQLVASTLIKLYETKNLNILNEALHILSEDKLISIPKLEPAQPTNVCNIKTEILKELLTPKKEPSTPKSKVCTPKLDLSVKEESISEIDGTPTGRTSPIIQSRKLRSGSMINQQEVRDKKKCPQNWPTSENKSIKLTYPSPTSRHKHGTGVRLRQGRLDWTKLKTNNVIDLTSSPELNDEKSSSQNNVQLLVKKESTDNDDTILPSPTSGPNNFSSLCKATSMISPIKFKKPALCLKSKSEVEKSLAFNDIENTPTKGCIGNQTEDSINLLKPVRFLNNLDENSIIKVMPIEDDVTHCEIPSSLSILEQVDLLEEKQELADAQKASPGKSPLGENKNLVNLPVEDIDSSVSLLRPVKVSPTEDKVKRSLSCKRPPALAEPLCKEQLPRTKSEKRKLPGWNCDECKEFFDELYEDNSEMLEKKMNHCSKHRGRNNPARPKTPEGFWNPRWSVPNDTEEFNKRNNVS